MNVIFVPISFALSIWVTGHALLRRRDARAAAWWITMAWFVPFLGPLLYYLFGINRVLRRAARLKKMNAAPPLSFLSESEAIGVGAHLPSTFKHLETLSHLVGGIVQFPLTRGNNVTPFFSGETAFEAMVERIEKAQRSVALCTYIFTDDKTGRRMVNALIAAKNRGVQVRVLIDDVGAGILWSAVYRRLKAGNIPVAYFMPSLAPWRMAYINLRNHKKILTVDGCVGFAGGMNVTDQHVLSLEPKNPSVDVHFQLDGPVVGHLQESFRDDWYFTTGELIEGEPWFPSTAMPGTVLARGIADGPDEDFEKCRWTLLSAIANAQHSIWIMTPYFLPDMSLINALNLAAMSGVHVNIILPEKNDLAFVRWATKATLWQVLERGVRVWMTKPPFNHSKLMVVDDAWTLFGSTNWDARSLRLNFEFNVETYNEELAVVLRRHMESQLALAQEITMADVDGRPLPVRLRDGLARLFSPIL